MAIPLAVIELAQYNNIKNNGNHLRAKQMTDEPIFQSIFGKQWQNLPLVIQKHYANRPYTSDLVRVEGVMKVEVSFFAKLISPVMRLAGALVPYEGENIPVTVNFRSAPNSNSYELDRIFYFPDRKPYYFRSRMVPLRGNEIIEFMPIGIGWHASYRYAGNKVFIEHCGYKIKLFSKLVRLPLEIIMGKGYAEEEAIDDRSFRMYMDIRHSLFGKFYAYMGEFTVKEMKLA